MITLATLLLLTCLVASESDRFFRGCVQESDRSRRLDACVFVPPRWLDSDLYRDLAHLALANGTHFRRGGNLDTVLYVIQVANQVSRGIVTRLEFTVVKSSCDESVAYSRKYCKPVGAEKSGRCQARFRYTSVLKLEDVICDPEVVDDYADP